MASRSAVCNKNHFCSDVMDSLSKFGLLPPSHPHLAFTYSSSSVLSSCANEHYICSVFSPVHALVVHLCAKLVSMGAKRESLECMLDNESVCSAWNLRRGSREVRSFLNVDQDIRIVKVCMRKRDLQWFKRMWIQWLKIMNWGMNKYSWQL